MAASNVMADAFDLLGSVPGIRKVSKVNLDISPMNILLLNFIIESGFNEGADIKQILENFPEESKGELKSLADELLEKGQLHEMKAKLEKFQK